MALLSSSDVRRETTLRMWRMTSPTLTTVQTIVYHHLRLMEFHEPQHQHQCNSPLHRPCSIHRFLRPSNLGTNDHV